MFLGLATEGGCSSFLCASCTTIGRKASLLPVKDLTNRMRQHAYEGMLCLVG